MKLILVTLSFLTLVNITPVFAQDQISSSPSASDMVDAAAMANTMPAAGESAFAVFAGGCFWCMESEFSYQKGVSDVTSGYAGGEASVQPTYEDVATGRTGFKEAVSVTYDPSVISYAQLLEIFWSNVDPFDDKGQFCDKGAHYLAAIFVSSPEEQKLAEESLAAVEAKFSRKVATQILPQMTFFEAEEYHQDYYKKNAERYERYVKGCGRDDRLESVWGEEAKKVMAVEPPAAVAAPAVAPAPSAE